MGMWVTNDDPPTLAELARYSRKPKPHNTHDSLALSDVVGYQVLHCVRLHGGGTAFVGALAPG